MLGVFRASDCSAISSAHFLHLNRSWCSWMRYCWPAWSRCCNTFLMYTSTCGKACCQQLIADVACAPAVLRSVINPFNTPQRLCNRLSQFLQAPGVRPVPVCPAEYAVITFNSKYAVSTPMWWRLSSHTLLVLQLMLKTMSATSSLAQIPVHLPDQHQQEPHHLLIATLTAGTNYLPCNSHCV